MAEQLNNLPTSLEPVGRWGNKDIPVQVSNVWYKFFLTVANTLDNFVGGVLGFSLDNSVTATGASQATAAVLSTEWVVVKAGAVNTGVLLNAFGAGTMTWVFNKSGSSKLVYPPVGAQIDALGVNAPYPLAGSKMQVFSQTDTGQYDSMQLG